MKKITLLAASIFILGGSIANATEKIKSAPERKLAVGIRNAEPIVFTERGVEFFIFADGQFDFNTRPSGNTINYQSNGRRIVNMTYGVPMNARNQNFGVKIEHDAAGKVRRIGNVFINYDAYDRIKRVGSVYMNYNRFALEQVGGLQIIYNRRGQIVDTVGSVKGREGQEPIQINRYQNIYEYGNAVGSNDVPRRYEESSNDQDQYFFKKSETKTKADDATVRANSDVRINRK